MRQAGLSPIDARHVSPVGRVAALAPFPVSKTKDGGLSVPDRSLVEGSKCPFRQGASAAKRSAIDNPVDRLSLIDRSPSAASARFPKERAQRRGRQQTRTFAV